MLMQSAANIPPRRRPLSEIEFCAWVARAMPGDRREYHRGFLACDTCPGLTSLDTAARHRLRRLAERAYWAATRGLVHLVQVRLGPEDFAYIAIARPKPRPASASLDAASRLLEAA